MDYQKIDDAHVITINKLENVELKPVLADGRILGTQTVLDMSNNALAMINCQYFDWTGEIWGLLKYDGHIISTSDAFYNAIGIGDDIAFGQASYQGTIELPNESVLTINSVNLARQPGNIILYNPYFGSVTHTSFDGQEYVIQNNIVIAINECNSPLIKDTVVISTDASLGLQIGDSVHIKQSIGAFDNYNYVISSAPMLVSNGTVNITNEQLDPDVVNGRAPRTAFGNSDTQMFLVVVDGRGRDGSPGMTLQELANFIVSLGAKDAINFDGGGSSQMVYQGQLMNDPGNHVRCVSDALGVYKKG